MKLRKPVTFLGKVYDELTFSEPTGITIAECGTPFKSSGIEGDRAGAIDSKAVHRLGVAMSGVPHEVIDMLSPPDWMEMSTVVISFFGDMPAPTSSSSISIAGMPGAI
jgi:hypothetical protein